MCFSVRGAATVGTVNFGQDFNFLCSGISFESLLEVTSQYLQIVRLKMNNWYLSLAMLAARVWRL